MIPPLEAYCCNSTFEFLKKLFFLFFLLFLFVVLSFLILKRLALPVEGINVWFLHHTKLLLKSSFFKKFVMRGALTLSAFVLFKLLFFLDYLEFVDFSILINDNYYYANYVTFSVTLCLGIDPVLQALTYIYRLGSSTNGYDSGNGFITALHLQPYWPTSYKGYEMITKSKTKDYITYGDVAVNPFPISGTLFKGLMKIDYMSHDGYYVYYATNFKAVKGISGSPLFTEDGRFVSIISHFIGSEVTSNLNEPLSERVSIVAFPLINPFQVSDKPDSAPPGDITYTGIIAYTEEFIDKVDENFVKGMFGSSLTVIEKFVSDIISSIARYINGLLDIGADPNQIVLVANMIPTMAILSALFSLYITTSLIYYARCKDWPLVIVNLSFYILCNMFSIVLTTNSAGKVNALVTIITFLLLSVNIVRLCVASDEDSVACESKPFHNNTNIKDLSNFEIFALFLILLPVFSYFDIPMLNTIAPRVYAFFTEWFKNTKMLCEDQRVIALYGETQETISREGSNMFNSFTIAIGKALSQIPEVSVRGNISYVDAFFRGKDSYTSYVMSYLHTPEHGNVLFIAFWYTVYRAPLMARLPFNPFNKQGETWADRVTWIVMGPSIDFAGTFKIIALLVVSCSFRNQLWTIPAMLLSNFVMYLHKSRARDIQAFLMQTHSTSVTIDYRDNIGRIDSVADMITQINCIMALICSTLAWVTGCYFLGFTIIGTLFLFYGYGATKVDLIPYLFLIPDNPCLVFIIGIIIYTAPLRRYLISRIESLPAPAARFVNFFGE